MGPNRNRPFQKISQHPAVIVLAIELKNCQPVSNIALELKADAGPFIMNMVLCDFQRALLNDVHCMGAQLRANPISHNWSAILENILVEPTQNIPFIPPIFSDQP